ncbi:protein huluwa [Salarias fasciatus]|uniref:protein huluwa n=1 Tax=Salarias fasciatus TaxID=181472 RepID=UPI0011770A14|nr:protein huluwa-like [Salarias fasciatus]
MSQTAPPDPGEGPGVSGLTLVVLLLVPCVVLLLLLHCLLLLCKLLVLSKRGRRSRRGGAEELLLRSTLHAVSDVSLSPLLGGGAASSLAGRVVAHPVTSSMASSREARGAGHAMRLLTPDGPAGSQRAPSTFRATASSSSRRATPGLDPLPGLRRSAAHLAQSDDSEAEVRLNLVPPNSPTAARGRGHRSCDLLTDVSPDAAGPGLEPPSQTSCSSMCAVGPGLDSDFGASAGVSLRILSADSDGLSGGAPASASALEWDYYDPCYVRQNYVPTHLQPRPALHTKHYWV